MNVDTSQPFNEPGPMDDEDPAEGRGGAGDHVDAVRAMSQDSCHEEAAHPQGRLNVVVRKTRHDIDLLLDRKLPSYEMKSRPRGLALIIANEKYEGGEERLGSEVDRANLTNLLEGLHFKVEHELDLSVTNLRHVLLKFAERPEHQDADMMVLAILSHGKDGRITDAERKDYPVERVYEQFNNQLCGLLKGKPKWFIVQACRGSDKDKASTASGVDDGKEEDEEKDVGVSRRKRKNATRDSVPFSSGRGDVDKARPTWEDMIISYSTIPGYASLRDHETGSWFIQSLVEVFSYHAADTEMIDLLRMTSNRLSQFTNEHNEKQTCNVEMRHLYKKIYFRPGLPIPDDEAKKARATLRDVSSTALSRNGSSQLYRSLSTPPPSPRRQQADDVENDPEVNQGNEEMEL